MISAEVPVNAVQGFEDVHHRPVSESVAADGGVKEKDRAGSLLLKPTCFFLCNVVLIYTLKFI